jgi:Uma2 family endonuclease
MADIVSDGRIVTECAVRTPQGTKVADVAWFSSARWEQVKKEYDSPVAPEICVEILSPANSDAEMETKKMLYFTGGAEEVWICDENGDIIFYDPKGIIWKSMRMPQFSNRVG